MPFRRRRSSGKKHFPPVHTPSRSGRPSHHQVLNNEDAIVWGYELGPAIDHVLGNPTGHVYEGRKDKGTPNTCIGSWNCKNNQAHYSELLRHGQFASKKKWSDCPKRVLVRQFETYDPHRVSNLVKKYKARLNDEYHPHIGELYAFAVKVHKGMRNRKHFPRPLPEVADDDLVLWRRRGFAGVYGRDVPPPLHSAFLIAEFPKRCTLREFVTRRNDIWRGLYSDFYNHHSYFVPMSRFWSLTWSRQLLSAVAFLHEKRLKHGNIHLRNISITSEWSIKLMPYDPPSHICGMDIEDKMTLNDHPGYMSSDLLRNVRFEAPAYDAYATDVYLVGCVIHTLCTGLHPFTSRTIVPELLQHCQEIEMLDRMTILRKVYTSPAYHHFLDKRTKGLIAACLRPWQARPSAHTLLNRREFWFDIGCVSPGGGPQMSAKKVKCYEPFLDTQIMNGLTPVCEPIWRSKPIRKLATYQDACVALQNRVDHVLELRSIDTDDGRKYGFRKLILEGRKSATTSLATTKLSQTLEYHVTSPVPTSQSRKGLRTDTSYEDDSKNDVSNNNAKRVKMLAPSKSAHAVLARGINMDELKLAPPVDVVSIQLPEPYPMIYELNANKVDKPLCRCKPGYSETIDGITFQFVLRSPILLPTLKKSHVCFSNSDHYPTDADRKKRNISQSFWRVHSLKKTESTSDAASMFLPYLKAPVMMTFDIGKHVEMSRVRGVIGYIQNQAQKFKSEPNLISTEVEAPSSYFKKPSLT